MPDRYSWDINLQMDESISKNSFVEFLPRRLDASRTLRGLYYPSKKSGEASSGGQSSDMACGDRCQETESGRRIGMLVAKEGRLVVDKWPNLELNQLNNTEIGSEIEAKNYGENEIESEEIDSEVESSNLVGFDSHSFLILEGAYHLLLNVVSVDINEETAEEDTDKKAGWLRNKILGTRKESRVKQVPSDSKTGTVRVHRASDLSEIGIARPLLIQNDGTRFVDILRSDGKRFRNLIRFTVTPSMVPMLVIDWDRLVGDFWM